MAQFAPVDKPNIVQKFSGHQPFMYLYLVYVLCCLVLNTLKIFEFADLCGIITAARSLYRLMPNGSPLTRQPPSDGQLYHAASRTWYNMRSANDKAVCSRHMAANAAKQRIAHVTPQPKPALPVSLPLCGSFMGMLPVQGPTARRIYTAAVF